MQRELFTNYDREFVGLKQQLRGQPQLLTKCQQEQQWLALLNTLQQREFLSLRQYE